MLTSVSKGTTLLLDACCIINFLATGRIEEILTGLPYAFATSRLIVDKEVITVMRASGTREAIPPSRLEVLPGLSILDLSGDEELNSFIHFATHLDDGEASVCALALSRKGAVATDDRKVIRLLAGTRPEVQVIQTPELLFQWARLLRLKDTEARKLIYAVEQYARFRPRRDAPRADWWEKLR